MKNFSRQRQAVIDVLCSTKTHPSASWIYEKVRETIPNVSLGTVYRNLALLESEGIIRKIPVGDSSEHFDGDTSMHSHFYCKGCKQITDIPLDTTDDCKKLEEKTGLSVESATYTFVGVCANCNKNKN